MSESTFVITEDGGFAFLNMIVLAYPVHHIQDCKETAQLLPERGNQ